MKLCLLVLICIASIACGGGSSPEKKSVQEVSIETPKNHSEYINTDRIVFSANSELIDNDEFGAEQISWVSNVGGELGVGSEITVRLATGEHLITMTAVDIYGNIYKDTITVRVDSSPNVDSSDTRPLLTIVSPNSYDYYSSSLNISFIAEASDQEDDNIDQALVWASDVDGIIGHGKSFIGKLSPAVHDITLSVTDSDDNKVTRSVVVSVEAGVDNLSSKGVGDDKQTGPNAPVAKISIPQSGELYLQGETITFIGFASDFDDISLSNLQLSWHSNLDGELGFGKKIEKQLTSGIHTITLVATDAQLNTHSHAITITVSKVENTFHLSGQVMAENSLSEVIVEVGEQRTITDVNGFFGFDNVVVPDSGVVNITYSKQGYITQQESLDVENGGSYLTTAQLQRFHYSVVKDFSATALVSIEDIQNNTQSQLMHLHIPANSIAEGGEHQINVFVGNGSNTLLNEIFSGNFSGSDSDGELMLEPVVFSLIELSSLQSSVGLELDRIAKIKLRLSDTYQLGGEEYGRYVVNDPIKGVIPWWLFNPRSLIWDRADADLSTPEIDAARVVANDMGLLYIEGDISYLTWWAAAHSYSDQSCLCVSVVDGNHNALQDKVVVAEGVSYVGQTKSKTDSTGKVCLATKRSIDQNDRQRIKLFTQFGNVKSAYDVDSSEEGDVANDVIFTPIAVGDVAELSSCTMLNNKLVIDQSGEIRGTVIREKEREPVSGVRIFNSLGLLLSTDEIGNFSFFAPLNQPITLWGNHFETQTVVASEENRNQFVELIIANNAPMIHDFSRNPLGLIVNDGKVIFSVSASDGDDDLLSYRWSVSGKGQINDTGGEVVQWIAPQTGSGISLVSVDVSDGHKISSHVAQVVWGGP